MVDKTALEMVDKTAVKWVVWMAAGMAVKQAEMMV
jgi:hypothetical protein